MSSSLSPPEEFIVVDSDEATPNRQRPQDDEAVVVSSTSGHAKTSPATVSTKSPPVASAPGAVARDDDRRLAELREELKELGLVYNEATNSVTEVDGSERDSESTVKDLRVQVDRLSRELMFAEEEKKDIMPLYERCKKNADLKDRVDALHNEILEEEATLKKQDQLLRALDAELSSVTAEYKKKREQRQQFTSELRGMIDGLLASVAHKVELTAAVDDEESEDFIHPGDCVEVAGQLAAARERDHLVVDRQLREIRCVCDFKRDECATLERDNAAAIQKTKESHDERIRALVYGFQDQRNKLLADIDEWTTITSDQALNLKVGHVHTNAKDRQRFDPLPSARVNPSAARPKIADTSRAYLPMRRKTAFRDPSVGAESDEVRFIAEKNKELLQEMAQIKTDISKVSANRTEAIQTTKKLQHQMKRDREHFDAALQKLEAQIYAEQASTKQIEKENRKLAEAVQQLEMVIQANRKHIKHCRTKTVPLPIE